MKTFFRVLFITASAICGSYCSAEAQSRSELFLQPGGNVLKNFTIYPVFYGDWSSAQEQVKMAGLKLYLAGIADYLSGTTAPKGYLPTPWQYGVQGAKLSSNIDLASPGKVGPVALCDPDAEAHVLCTDLNGSSKPDIRIRDIITHEQLLSKLPPTDGKSLVIVFLPSNFILNNNACNYHSSINSTPANSYAVVTTDSSTGCGPLLGGTAHEIFEAATDPVVSLSWVGSTGGSSEANDICTMEQSRFNIAEIDNKVGHVAAKYSADNPGQTFPWNSGDIRDASVPGIADDTELDPAIPGNVFCSKTGYYKNPTPTPPPQCTAYRTYRAICAIACHTKDCFEFYPVPLFDILGVLNPPCLACGYEVVIGGPAVENWTAEVVTAKGALIPSEMMRRGKTVVLQLKPNAEEIKSGAIAGYRLRLTAGKRVKTDAHYKITARLNVLPPGELGTK